MRVNEEEENEENEALQFRNKNYAFAKTTAYFSLERKD